MQNAVDTTKNCTENRVPYLSIHEIHLKIDIKMKKNVMNTLFNIKWQSKNKSIYKLDIAQV